MFGTVGEMGDEANFIFLHKAGDFTATTDQVFLLSLVKFVF